MSDITNEPTDDEGEGEPTGEHPAVEVETDAEHGENSDADKGDGLDE